MHGEWIHTQAKQCGKKINEFECDVDSSISEVDRAKVFLLYELENAINYYQRSDEIATLMVENIDSRICNGGVLKSLCEDPFQLSKSNDTK